MLNFSLYLGDNYNICAFVSIKRYKKGYNEHL